MIAALRRHNFVVSKTKSMKKIVVLLVMVGALFTVTQTHSMGDGGFNMTGAPGEGNCTGCHQGTANQDANGQVRITVEGSPVTYEPGKTYTVTVTTSYPGRSKFGFAFNVRRLGVGWIEEGKITADSSAQIRTFGFATHTRESNQGNNQRSWTFQWKAPDSNVGTIVFYAAGVAANNDLSNTGDQVYTTSLSLLPAATGLKEHGVSLMSLKNTLVEQQLELVVNMATSGKVNLRLFNVRGQLISTLMDEVHPSGNHQWVFKRPDCAENGLCFLQIETPDGIQVSRLVFR